MGIKGFYESAAGMEAQDRLRAALRARRSADEFSCVVAERMADQMNQLPCSKRTMKAWHKCLVAALYWAQNQLDTVIDDERRASEADGWLYPWDYGETAPEPPDFTIFGLSTGHAGRAAR